MNEKNFNIEGHSNHTEKRTIYPENDQQVNNIKIKKKNENKRTLH